MEDYLALFVGAPIFVALCAATAFGWIEIGPLGWMVLIGCGLLAAAAHIAFGLLAAVADLLAGRRD